MIILDENIPESQRQLLRSWRIPVRQIGHEVSRKGVKDEAIIPLIYRMGPVSFFTRDLGFYSQNLCHEKYSLVCLDVGQYEAASFIRRFLKHPAFNTQTKRSGKVIRVSHSAIRLWKLHYKSDERLGWN